MNQILLTEKQNNKKRSNNKYNRNNSSDMKRIMIFFGIAILVFALLIVALYASKLSKNKNKEEKPIGKPELVLEQVDNKVTIKAKAEAGIDKLIYSWNDDEPQEEEKNGIPSLEEALEIPEGQNTFNVKIIDRNGEKAETSQNYTIEEDPNKAKIEISEIAENDEIKIKITATDENNKIKYIKYKWNDEEETVINATTDEQTTIETLINVKRGKNTLTVTAINGKDEEKTADKIFNGVNKPVIDVLKDGNKLIMTITHDMGFEKVEFNVNGQIYNYDENYSEYDPEKKELSYSFELVEGENTVIIHAISNEKISGPEGQKGTEAIYRGKCNYTAE